MRFGKGFLLSAIVLLSAAALFLTCASTEIPAAVIYETPSAPLPVTVQEAAVKGASWTFDDPYEGTCGWYLVHDEFDQYRGRAFLTRDDVAFGNGMLRLDLDFSADRNADWSEPKLKNIFYTPIELNGVTQFSFDFYMNPALHKTGYFMAKVYAGKDINAEVLCERIAAGEDAGRGFLKTKVIIPLDRTVQGVMEEMYFSIAGFRIDYAGPVYIDNLRWE